MSESSSTDSRVSGKQIFSVDIFSQSSGIPALGIFVVIILIILLAIFVPLAIYNAYRTILGSVPVSSTFLPTFFDVVFGLMVFGLWYSPVRFARFYEGGVRLSGRGLKAEFPYSDISSVIGVESKRGQIVGVRITLKGHVKPYVIPGNPRNEELPADLYDWLTEKVKQGPEGGNMR